MRLLVSFALVFALNACELPRPEGSYVPIPSDAEMERGLIGEDAGSSDAGVVIPTIPGGGPSGVGMPGGPGGGSEGGGTPGGGMPGGGAGGTDAGMLNPAAQRLKQLEGRYLMRMDMLSTASARVAGLIQVSVRNRVSHLVASQLYVEGEELKGTERLCYQTFEHVCTNGCTSLTTTMHPSVRTELIQLQVPRSYTVSGMKLTGASQTMLLGFDASKNASLPTQNSDSRVWDLVSGNPREGMLLTIDTRSRLKNLMCQVYNVQGFVSRFEGQLGGTSEAPSLENREFVLSTAGSTGETLGASNSDCAADDGATPSTVKESVRFVKVTDQIDEQTFWSCPSQTEWDSRLKAPSP